MLTPRPYQQEAIESIYSYFFHKTGNPLIVLPTGSGKSLVIAAFVKGAIETFRDTRILVLSHVKEILLQNTEKMLAVWPDAPAGIYSAALNKRDIGAKILFAGIQSIHKRAYEVQQCDLILIDEAHLLSRHDASMYRGFLSDLITINRHLKVVGFTATPYRLDSGLLHDGDGRLFTDIAYEVPVLKLIEQGYLLPLIPLRTEVQLDVSRVGARGGEYIASELEAAVDIEAITRAAASEIVKHGEECGSWLVFCAGIKHAEHARDALRDLGVAAACVTGKTPAQERAATFAAFKSGKLRALCGANVFTTGFDAPGADLIAFLRPTKSPGLFVQMCGRGMRLAPGKERCLVLDFAGNTLRFGPVDTVDGRRKKNDEPGEAPAKMCPKCDCICAAGARVCPNCGYKFPEPTPDITATSHTRALLSTQVLEELIEVDRVEYRRHEKPDRAPSMRVDYFCGMAWHSEWVCFEHPGYPREKAVGWWQRRSSLSVPCTVAEALEHTDSLATPSAIAVKPVGKYTDIVRYVFPEGENAKS